MSPHPQYNSRVLSFLSRQFGSIRDRTEELARYAKMVCKWTVEAAAFPFYKAVQERKVLGQKVNRTVTKAVRLLSAQHHKSKEKAAGKTSSSAIIRVLDAIAMTEVASPTEVGSTQISIQLKPNQTNASLVGKLRKVAQKVSTLFRNRPKRYLQTANTKLTHQAQIQKVENIQIQSIASELVTRRIVLITPENNVLDVLSSEQQIALQKRIIWEVASYYFHQRRQHHSQKRLAQVKRILASIKTQGQPIASLAGREKAKRLVASLQFLPKQLFGLVSKHTLGLTGQKTLSLTGAEQPKSKFDQGILHSISQAIATWLKPTFPSKLLTPSTPTKEGKKSLSYFEQIKQQLKPATGLITKAVIGAIASMPLVVIPAIAAETSVPQQLPQKQAKQVESELWIDPSDLKAKLSLDELQGMIAHQEQSKTWLTLQPKAQQTKGSEPALSHPKTTQASYSGIHQDEFGTEIRVQAEFLGYETHLLEDILSWLDKIMVQLEAFFGTLWKWIGFATILFLTTAQNIRQRIWE